MANLSSYEQWVEKYKPIQNPFTKESAFNNTLFETYGDEVEYVRERALLSENTPFGPPRGVVWTMWDTEGGATIQAGFHYVNRIGYFITENEYETEWDWVPLKEEEE